MKTITEYYKELIEQQVKDSKWYKSIPYEYKHDVSIEIKGIEYRLFSSYSSSHERPCVVIHCTCFDDYQDFVLLINDSNMIETDQN